MQAITISAPTMQVVAVNAKKKPKHVYESPCAQTACARPSPHGLRLGICKRSPDHSCSIASFSLLRTYALPCRAAARSRWQHRHRCGRSCRCHQSRRHGSLQREAPQFRAGYHTAERRILSVTPAKEILIDPPKKKRSLLGGDACGV